MMEPKTTEDTSWIFDALLPSAPPTITAIAGFYIFHFLAVRRQKREEIRQACDNFKNELINLSEISIKCWDKPANLAKESGEISEYKSKIFQCDLKMSTLKRAQSGFSDISNQYRLLKKIMDEVFVSGDWLSIEGESRDALPEHGASIRNASARLAANTDRKFFEVYH